MPSEDKPLDVEKSAAAFMPPWAWAACAIIMFTSFALRQAGIDISTPLNTYFMAKADLVKAEANLIHSEKAPDPVVVPEPVKAPEPLPQPVPQPIKVIVPLQKEYDHSDIQARLRTLENDDHAEIIDERLDVLEDKLEDHKHSLFKRRHR